MALDLARPPARGRLVVEKGAAMSHISYVSHWILTTLSDGYRSGWDWLSQLDRQQWMVLLVVAMAGGFLCMRGHGGRNK